MSEHKLRVTWAKNYRGPKNVLLEKPHVNEGNCEFKKRKLSLLALHAPIHHDDSLYAEIAKFLIYSVPRDATDSLKWWKTVGLAAIPQLAHLSRVISSASATSARSEHVWSIAGLIMSSRRSSISPGVLERTILCTKIMSWAKTKIKYLQE